ncbi:MAG: WD40 repeat domain-containing protein, partial [Verrucomicrobiota bacterium]
MKALEKNRERRYASPAALAEDIHRYFRHDPVTAAAPSRWYRSRKFCRKNRVAVVGAVAVVCALCLGGSLAVWQAMRATRHADEAEALAARSKELAASEAQSKSDALATLADAYRDTGLRAAADHDLGTAQLWFSVAAEMAHQAGDRIREQTNWLRADFHERAAVVPVANLEKAGGFAVNCLRFDGENQFFVASSALTRRPPMAALNRVADGKRLDFGLKNVPLAAVAVEPSGEVAAISYASGRVELRATSGDFALLKGITLPGSPQPISHLLFSRNGRFLLIGSQPSRLWDMEAERFIGGPLESDHELVHAAFSPDDRRFLTLGRLKPRTSLWGNIRVYQTPKYHESGELAPLFAPLEWTHRGSLFPGVLPRFTSDGRLIFTRATADVWTGEFDYRTPAQIRLYNSRTGVLEKRYEGAGHLLLSDNRQYLALGSGALLDAGRGNQLWQGRRRSLRAFTPDSRTLVNVEGHQFQCSTGELQHSFWPKIRAQAPIVLSEDGAMVGTDSHLFTLARPRPWVRIVDPANGHLSFSHDGRYLVPTASTWSRSDTTCVYSCESGNPAGPRIGEPGNLILHGDFSPRESLLALATANRPPQLNWELGPGKGAVSLWNWKQGNLISDPVAMPSEPRWLRYHPSGDWIAVVCAGGEVVQLLPESGEVIPLFKISTDRRLKAPHGNGMLEFFDEGATLLAWGMGKDLMVWNVSAGRLQYPKLTFQYSVTRAEVKEGVLFALTPTGPHFYHADSGEPIKSQLETTGSSFGSALSDDGQSILWATSLGSDAKAQLYNWRTGKIEAKAIPIPNADHSVATFVPGSPWLAIYGEGESGEKLGFYDQFGKSLCPPLAVGERPQGMTLSPGGRFLAASSRDGATVVVDLEAWFSPGEAAHLDKESRL